MPDEVKEAMAKAEKEAAEAPPPQSVPNPSANPSSFQCLTTTEAQNLLGPHV